MADSSMLRILQLILVYNRVYQLPKKKKIKYLLWGPIVPCVQITLEEARPNI